MTNTTTTGAAGEHHVMCQLLRRGLIAALAPTGVPNADIIVTDEIGDKLCAVQVKTRLVPGGDKGWHMSVKHESIESPNYYYCFVGFETEPPGLDRTERNRSGCLKALSCQLVGAAGKERAAA